MTKTLLFIILTLLGTHSELQAADIEVEILTVPGQSWGAEELEMIKQAAGIVFNRISKFEVAQCAYRESTREPGSKDQLRRRWSEQIPVINKRRQVSLTIAQERLPKGILGQARVGQARVDRREQRIDRLEISLNKESIHQAASQHSSATALPGKLDRWVNAIAHELVHNLGYRHPTTGDWNTDYPGYFVTELAFCVASDGQYGSKTARADRRL